MSSLFSYLFLVFYSEGVAGLAVTYGLNLNMLQAWVIWNLCNVENRIISVERLLQYTTIPSEPPLVIESNQPDRSWPLRGKVDIHDLQVLAVLVYLFHNIWGHSCVTRISCSYRSVMPHTCRLCCEVSHVAFLEE